MLKVRVIPTLLHKGFGLVKGVHFDSRRAVGSPMQAIKVYNLRNVDELVFLDVTATLEGRGPDLDLIDDLADDCFMPFAVGGGVSTVDDVRDLLAVGADKVVIGTAALERPSIVREASDRFGAQCVVVSIDTRRHDDGTPEVFVRSGTQGTGRDPVDVAREMEAAGAGELLVQSIDRDGVMDGYDVDTVRRIADAVSVPVVASGGAGIFEHMAEVLRDGCASAVAASAMFHFTEQTPMEAKQYLREQGFPVRI
ncbi:MAG: Imidazole glycerol phosphate synthase cyclase subunit [Actinomycetia bacterium]|nr:Imidazole glycerol phosphate synthase cyclase subunit [Actinomycetes bacterium]